MVRVELNKLCQFCVTPEGLKYGNQGASWPFGKEMGENTVLLIIYFHFSLDRKNYVPYPNTVCSGI